MKDCLFKRIYDDIRVTPKDLSLMVDWSDVKKSIKFLYPDLKKVDNYEHLFNQIQTTRRRKPKTEDPLDIRIGGLRELKKDEYGDRDEWYVMSGEEYSMSFLPWNRLINTRINKSTLEHYRAEDILAHFIWEISWYGNEKEMQKASKRILSSVKECKEHDTKNKPTE